MARETRPIPVRAISADWDVFSEKIRMLKRLCRDQTETIKQQVFAILETKLAAHKRTF